MERQIVEFYARNKAKIGKKVKAELHDEKELKCANYYDNNFPLYMILTPLLVIFFLL